MNVAPVWFVLVIVAVVLGVFWLAMRVMSALLIDCRSEECGPSAADCEMPAERCGTSPLVWLLPGLMFGVWTFARMVSQTHVVLEDPVPVPSIAVATPERVAGAWTGEQSLAHQMSLFNLPPAPAAPLPPAMSFQHEQLAVGPIVLLALIGGFLLASFVLSSQFRHTIGRWIPLALGIALVAALFVGTTWSVRSSQQDQQRREVEVRQMQRQQQDVMQTYESARIMTANALHTGDEAPMLPTVHVAPEQPAGDLESSSVATMPVLVFNGNSTDGQRMNRLPDWVTQQQVANLDALTVPATQVVSSGQYASISEAEQELMDRLKVDVQRRLVAEYNITAPTPTTQELRDSRIIHSRANEQLELTVGEFTHPMYRVHWLVNMRPETDQVFFESWRSQTVNQRLYKMGLLLGVVTLLLGGTSLYLHRWARPHTV